MSSDGETAESGQSVKSARVRHRVKKCERVSTDRDPSAELCRVGVRVPPFWVVKPKIWFAQIEAQFNLARITDDNTKFYYVLAHLDGQYSAVVEDIIENPPASGKFEKLKSELIKRLSISRQKKVKQLLQSEELGDRKPSQFLRHLQQLAGPNMPDEFITDVWTSRLPSNLQTIIASQANMTLQDLADLADRVHDIAPSSPHMAVASVSRLESAMDMMARQITELTKQVSELTTRHHRPRSRSRHMPRQRTRSTSRRSHSNYKKFPVCWYHYKFGNLAKKCIPPCDYDSGKVSGSR
ncbi:uncharacterized protein LOC124530502 [Vanessa cardui]|uniref:uncharacterized protein LOC124530502 n=1 Tax=Vanessa cardui TaxID=171605 RepID=UPI001F13F8F5|nr:uncharacterized protein LOC124530502 [Vanessa cardui]